MSRRLVVAGIVLVLFAAVVPAGLWGAWYVLISRRVLRVSIDAPDTVIFWGCILRLWSK